MEFIWILAYGLLFLKLKDVYLVVGIVIFCASLFVYLHKKHRLEIYGLYRISISWFRFLLYSIPYTVIIICNVYLNFNNTLETVEVCDIIIMFFCAFVEELFFRGWFFGKFSVKNYVIISSVLFAICHMLNIFTGADFEFTVFQVLWAFCVGVSFALLRLICGSIIPGVIFHSLINVTSFGGLDVSITNWIFTLVLAVFCMVYMMIIYYISTKEKRDL